MQDERPTEVTYVNGKDHDELKKAETDLVEHGWQSEGPVIQNDDGTLSRKMVKV